jgi:hypothetical protein
MAMTEEYDTLMKNRTFHLVPLGSNLKILFNANGYIASRGVQMASLIGIMCLLKASFSRCDMALIMKIRLVLLLKPLPCIRLVLAIAVSRGWGLWPLDVKNAFLQ